MINIQGVKKSFSHSCKMILNGIDLHLSSGDFCILIGMNGCGKSTLLKTISGEVAADYGTVKVASKIAKVTQDINIGTISNMTLFENIVLSEVTKPKLAFYKRYEQQIIDKLKLLNIGLEEHIDRPLSVLSGGQRQVVAMFMAVNSGRNVLLLDEHTSALDPKMQAFLMEYTAKSVIELGLTTLMITHKMDDAIKYGNRLIMLYDGKIVFEIDGDDKKKLQPEDLLKLFHIYEDRALRGGEYDNRSY